MFSSFVLIFLVQAFSPSGFVISQDSVEKNGEIIPVQSVNKELYSHSALYLDINDASSVLMYKRTDRDKIKFQTIVVKN